MTELLVAYDGSAPARAALASAAALFPDAGVSVLVVHPEPVTVAEAGAARMALPDSVVRTGVAALEREILSEARSLADDGVAAAQAAGAQAVPATAGTSGAVWRAILAEAGRRGSDVIACGTRGLGGFGRAVLGSTSSGLVVHADRPVLVIPEGALEPSGPLLLAFDGSPAAEEAIRAAARLLPGRRAVVAYAWRSAARTALAGRVLLEAPDPEVRDIARELDERQERLAAETAERGAGLARELGLDARAALVPTRSSVWSALLEGAGEAGASVLVVGSRGQGSVTSAVLGSVSSACAHNADRPVLVVG